MPNHLHLICRSNEKTLEQILRDFKSYTAKEFIKMIERLPMESRKEWLIYLLSYFGKIKSTRRDYNFWKPGNYPVELRTEKFIRQKLNYLHNNPVKAGYVEKPEHWKFSSAYKFADIKTEDI